MNDTSKFLDNVHVFNALLYRDLTILYRSLRSKCIDILFLVICEVITFGKFFPLLGMPTSFVLPVFIGSGLFFTLFILGNQRAYAIAYALPHGHIIEYQITLPLPKRWLLVKYILSFVIEVGIITIPAAMLGVMILGDMSILALNNVLLFFGTCFLVLIFLAVFFLTTGFIYDFEWYRNNVWPRRLTPLLCLTSSVIVWKKLVLFSPTISALLLLNPFTYVVEGLRASLIGGDEHLPLSISVCMLTGWIAFYWWRLERGINKRLDLL